MIPPSPNLPSLVAPRPLVWITGFLGAGKTTYLRGLLEAMTARRLAADVILNDYENAELDAETLRGRVAGIETLAAACACCKGMDALLGLAVAAARTRHDVLAIELNGTADPIPLLESFTLLESKLRLHPRWQVCVVDAAHFGRRGRYSGLEHLQLEAASHFMIGHADELGPAERRKLLARIAAVNPKAGETSPEAMAEAVARAVARNHRLWLAARSPVARQPGARSHRHRLAHEFTGCQILLPETVSRDVMCEWLGSLPTDVFRAKALVTVKGEPGVRRLFERVGSQVMGDPLEVPISARVPSSAICIGPDLDPDELLQEARHAFGETCRLPVLS